jgi:hypothetical protein
VASGAGLLGLVLSGSLITRYPFQLACGWLAVKLMPFK